MPPARNTARQRNETSAGCHVVLRDFVRLLPVDEAPLLRLHGSQTSPVGLFKGEIQDSGDCAERLVECPESGAGKASRRKEMGIHPPDTSPIQAMVLDKLQHFIVFGDTGSRQDSKKGEDLMAIRQRATSQLANDERMRYDLLLIQQA